MDSLKYTKSATSLPLSQVCPNSVRAQWELRSNDIYYCEVLVSERYKATFTLDSIGWLKVKLCEVKRFLTSVSFGVAAYDVDYDSLKKVARRQESIKAPSTCLSGVRQLSDFLLKDYNGYLECVGLNISTSRAAGSLNKITLPMPAFNRGALEVLG
ncbi:hypothetical protein MRX96_029061 [Rhipicephalus microplus]